MYYQIPLNDSIEFISLHTIDTSEWRPRFKVLTDMDIIFSSNSTVNILCDSDNICLEPRQAFLALPGQTIRILENPQQCPTGVWVLHFKVDKCKSLSFSDINVVVKKENNSVTSGFFYLKNNILIKNDMIYKSLELISQEIKYKRFGYNRKINICLIDILHELHCSCMENALFGSTLHTNMTGNVYCRKVIDYLHSNFMNKINAKDIEQFINLSYDYINAIFKELTGTTIMICLEDIRITRARELIATTSLNFHEIAEMVGIKDPHYFSKRFREREGMSPSAYRKMMQ